MSRKILFVGLLGLASVTYSWYATPEQVFSDLYQAYFESLKLHYEVPAGCAGNTTATSGYGGTAGKPVCALAADFNGDGNVDFAALFEYIGAGSRLGNRYLDLIVLYSSNIQGEPQHQIFTGMGGVGDQGEVDTFVSIQSTGEINLPSGIQNLDKPGINLLRTSGQNDDPWTYPTIYWDERNQTFYSITKAND